MNALKMFGVGAIVLALAGCDKKQGNTAEEPPATLAEVASKPSSFSEREIYLKGVPMSFSYNTGSPSRLAIVLGSRTTTQSKDGLLCYREGFGESGSGGWSDADYTKADALLEAAKSTGETIEVGGKMKGDCLEIEALTIGKTTFGKK